MQCIIIVISMYHTIRIKIVIYFILWFQTLKENHENIYDNLYDMRCRCSQPGRQIWFYPFLHLRTKYITQGENIILYECNRLWKFVKNLGKLTQMNNIIISISYFYFLVSNVIRGLMGRNYLVYRASRITTINREQGIGQFTTVQNLTFF